MAIFRFRVAVWVSGANRDPLFFAGSPIRPEFVEPIAAFMIANSDDERITALGNVTPATVPSGLPVAD